MKGGALPIVLSPDRDGIHKFKVCVPKASGLYSTIHFGRKGYSDYTKHKDSQRMGRYLTRHRKRENWTRAGRYTAGFWSRWILWSRPSFRAALKQTEKVLGQRIIFRAK
jgi:Family of unknown function (DUF5754)